MGQTLRAALGPASALEQAAEGGEEAFESFTLEGGSGTAEERRRAVRRARRRGEEGLAREVECVFVAEDVELLRAARRREESLRRSAAQEAADGPAQVTRTTAEPRPNAYIPDELGIPRPYGALAPFNE